MTNMTTTIPCCHHRDKIQALIVHRRELAMQIHAEAAKLLGSSCRRAQ
jgi:superfamily II DNA/RNA helicase